MCAAHTPRLPQAEGARSHHTTGTSVPILVAAWVEWSLQAEDATPCKPTPATVQQSVHVRWPQSAGAMDVYVTKRFRVFSKDDVKGGPLKHLKETSSGTGSTDIEMPQSMQQIASWMRPDRISTLSPEELVGALEVRFGDLPALAHRATAASTSPQSCPTLHRVDWCIDRIRLIF